MNAAKLRFFLMAVLTPVAGAATEHAQNLTDLDLRTLMDMDVNVTSVAKKATRLSDAPAAVTVITQDDMRRLGITRVPEALRLVPGLDVARINANQWSISSRGFNSQYANKLLVLIDGRSVYTPSFGGVFWDVQDLLVEDIDRIEVIRGPGAALWGANAVNGVINIATRSAKDTPGGLVQGVTGSEERPAVSARFGSAIGEDLHYRTYVKYLNAGSLEEPDGSAAPDRSHSLRAGFRTDWDRKEQGSVTLQGDAYSGREGESIAPPVLEPPFGELQEITNEQRGVNLLGRWTRKLSDGSEMSLQSYLDHARHEVSRTVETRDTFDIQWERRLPPGARHDVIWGAGYRFTTDEFNETGTLIMNPSQRDLNLYTMFVQDDIALVPGLLNLTLGSKVEHNDYTGFEVQPSARMRWTPHERHIFWASLSRAVSTPTRLLRDARVNLATFQLSSSGPVFETSLFGNAEVDSERLDALEVGYRFEAAANLSFDLATFYNRYEGLTIAVSDGTDFELAPVPHVLVKQRWVNGIDSRTHGAELSVQWQPLDKWRVTAAYSYLALDVPDEFYDAGSPEQQASIRSYLNLRSHLELNAAAYYVDRIRTPVGSSLVETPAYLRVDAGMTWHATDTLELGLWGQNLLDRRHRESSSFSTTLLTEVPRSVLGRITWRF